ncbi:glycosyltransferase family 2 protein [Hypericibacter sp.]|uniref:glycosyltransferase family 2 protein n=1 Tax=Hypericibacter sp. TaxID=2705401 RepID=UPI003D6DA6B6
MQILSVLIASRLAPSTRPQANGSLLVEAAIQSIRAQTAATRFELRIVIGVDQGTKIPAALANQDGVRIVESDGKTQAAALNAAARHIDGEFVSFLEDDDIWDPFFLEAAFAALNLKSFGFASSNPLEISEADRPLRLKDFPTMSGWLMPRATWNAVGAFDESYRWHLDNDWLGRLNRLDIARCHLIEAGAPRDWAATQRDRPEIAALLKHSNGKVELLRHSLTWPLVRRLLHDGSGIALINRDAGVKSESRDEYERLIRDYGCLPW